jgi:hypothetical protein
MHFAEHNFGGVWPLWTYLFCNSIIGTRIQNTIYSVIFKLVSSDFHLLFRCLQNIYIFSAAHETFIWKKRPNRFCRSKYSQWQASGMVCMCIDRAIKHGQAYTWRVRASKTRYFEKFKINISTLCRFQTKLCT